MIARPLFLIFSALLLVSCALFFVVKPAVALVYVDVSVLQAKVMVDANPFLVVLDVRNQSEYDAGHVRNARLVPVWQLGARLDELNMNDEILVYCMAGARSANASMILASNGFLHVYNMLEGMNGWTAAGHPVYVKYPSIQAAINNATNAQTLYISTGSYNESLSIGRSITLAGENASTTLINEAETVLNIHADNVSISDFTIQYRDCACYGYSAVNVTNCHNITVRNNIIISDDFGIRVVGARGVVVAHNNITRAAACIIVLDSSEVSVNGNDVTAYGGMEIDNSTNSVFSSNTILSHLAGIFVGDSRDNLFFGNNVSSTDLIGLSISTCYNNSFLNNYISSDSPYGLFIWQSNNNSISHNSFLRNGSRVLNNNSTNSWDNGLEGNYWSNYKGSDVNLNGIGDTHHIIDSTNLDNYPLMGPFHSFSTSLESDVDIVSNSTIESFDFIESSRTIELRASNTNANQTIGFCRIGVPHILIDPHNGPISVVIDDGQTPVLFLNDTLYDNGTHRWIYFSYPQSTHEILIVPEFPTFLVLPLFMIMIVTVTIAYTKYARKHQHVARMRVPKLV